MYCIVTGAAGFIGSNIVRALNARGITDIVAVDNLTQGDKFRNLVDCHIADYLDKHEFITRFERGDFTGSARVLFHQGACSDTTERDGRYMMDNNYRYSVRLFERCQMDKVALIYASSAATYGASTIFREEPTCEGPLNVYGYSKLLFDQYIRKARLQQRVTSQVVGFRYFNVYGPHEQHKGRMASVAFHHFNQMKATQQVKLFGAWDGWGAGQQSRDFVYIDDVAAVNLFFMDNPDKFGIFNVGSGRAQPFNDVARAVLNRLRHHAGDAELSLEQMVSQKKIEYVDFPDDLKGRYQSFTQADISQLREVGYDRPFFDVAGGVVAYVDFLAKA